MNYEISMKILKLMSLFIIFALIKKLLIINYIENFIVCYE